MCTLFAATYPERTSSLVMLGSFPRRLWAPDYPWGPTADQREQWLQRLRREWGTPIDLETRAPSAAQDARFGEWWGRMLRLSASPSAAAALMRMNNEIDIRHVLPAIRVPTLIVHNKDDRLIPAAAGRYMAERIADARYVELDGQDHLPWVGNAEAILDEIEDFLTGVRRGPDPDRVLATVMFTDVVDATRRASELGDHRWRDVLAAFQSVARDHVARFRGREIDTAGDGLLAAFDGPARAVRAAAAVGTDVKRLGLQVRSGIHTGECEIMGAKLSGVAVHIGARIAGLANAGEVLVSSTVRDLVAGSGLRFEDRGVHALKGVSDQWHLFAVDTN
jgi:class 3 adenylate cyclase